MMDYGIKGNIMTPQQVISQLLESNTSNHTRNRGLLKKIFVTTFLGRLRINGLPPDDKITVGDYLFDKERTLFDFTRLSDNKRAAFLKWLLDPHQEDKKNFYFNKVYVNDYRGFTSEVALNWWGRLSNWFQNRYSEKWQISELELSLNYQLLGIEMCHGKQGILIGFNQFLAPSNGTKYKAPNDTQLEPLGNVKRVFITDKLVDHLIHLDLKSFKAAYLYGTAHPQAINVTRPEARFAEMHHYRFMQKFIKPLPWYIRIWRWFLSYFITDTKNSDNSVTEKDTLIHLYQNETTEIYQRKESKEIVVKENRPPIENLVLCGGGPKIFVHVGIWKALNEAKIHPKRFAGSSAGAIMALLCYLGYSSDEIEHLLTNFRQEHLVHYNIDRNGLSDSHSLKTALDYAIVKKVKQIVDTYHLPYPKGKITFAVLDALKKQCPDCGLGDELIVTGTNKRQRKTSYFSLARTPNMEVSAAVKTSSLFPVVYRDTLIDGQEHNDGGILSNFPTEVFSDDYTTFLESEYGNNLKTLAVQFDNGTERTTIDRIMEQVYRENFFLNWIYSRLTGVDDPASGWVDDRWKLRWYAMQTIVPNTDDIPTSGFSVEADSQAKMIENGYNAARDYLNVRYGSKEETTNKSQEQMYSTFSSLGDLLAYCCYRGDKQWFETVHNLILESSLPNKVALIKQSMQLRAHYFDAAILDESEQAENVKPPTFFGNPPASQQCFEQDRDDYHNILLILHPLFLKLIPDLVLTKQDKKILDAARHALSLDEPFNCLNYFERIKGNCHVLLYIVIHFIREMKDNPSAELYRYFEDISKLLYTNSKLLCPEYYRIWDLSIPQCIRVIKLLNKGEYTQLTQLLNHLCNKDEPLQTIKEGIFYDDFSDGSVKGDWTGISP